MMFSVFSLRKSRAALVTLLGGVFFAVSPLAASPPAAVAAGTVTLAWDASSGTNAIANYKVYYGAASATYTNSVAAGTNLTVSVSNLVVGTTYYFAATAVDTSGLESDYSTEVSTMIAPPNQPPTLNTPADVIVNENAGQQTVNLSGISSGAANESQTLTITASSSNTGVVPNPTVTYTSPNATGSIRFTPVANTYGSATITVTVNDGGTGNNVISRTFAVAVNQVNTPPTISSIADRVVAMDGATPAIAFTIGDAETSAAGLTVSGSSDNAALVLPADIAFGGSNSNRTVTITPEPGQTGVANVTITVNDGTDTTSSVFQLSVRQRPAAPGGFRVATVPP